jgi:hypothetical protein
MKARLLATVSGTRWNEAMNASLVNVRAGALLTRDNRHVSERSSDSERS